MSGKVFVEGTTGQVTLAKLPMVEGRLLGRSEKYADGHIPTVGGLAKLQQHAYDEGLELGHTEGLKKGHAEAVANIKRQSALACTLLDELAAPFEALDESVLASIADLSLLIARHVIRRELKIDPGEIVAVVRDTIRELPVASRSPRVHLNPDDIELVREALAIGDDPRSWALEPDPLVTRGGCKIETETSRVDATIETRLAAIVSKMLGGDRESDRSGAT